MSSSTLTCPHCGFSNDIDQEPASLNGKTITCPKCKTAFTFTLPEPVSPEAEFIVSPAPDPNEKYSPLSSSQQKLCPTCGKYIHIKAEICPECGVRVSPAHSKVNKVALLLVTFFLGGLGGHKFYLKKYLQGVLYLLFFWTYIPALAALIEFIVYACKSEPELQEKYPDASSGGVFLVLFVPIVLFLIILFGAVIIPEFEKSGNAAANAALTSCQSHVVSYYSNNGMLPTDASQLQCQANHGVYLYYLMNGSDEYQLISYSEFGDKAFLININDSQIIEREKPDLEAELAKEIGAEQLSPGFHFVR